MQIIADPSVVIVDPDDDDNASNFALTAFSKLDSAPGPIVLPTPDEFRCSSTSNVVHRTRGKEEEEEEPHHPPGSFDVQEPPLLISELISLFRERFRGRWATLDTPDRVYFTKAALADVAKVPLCSQTVTICKETGAISLDRLADTVDLSLLSPISYDEDLAFLNRQSAALSLIQRILGWRSRGPGTVEKRTALEFMSLVLREFACDEETEEGYTRMNFLSEQLAHAGGRGAFSEEMLDVARVVRSHCSGKGYDAIREKGFVHLPSLSSLARS